MKHGLSKQWHNNGILSSEFNYKYGKANGVCKSWHENGQLEFEWNIIENDRDGLCEQWHDNGNLEEVGNFNNGIQDGIHKKFYEDGSLKEVRTFNNGIEEGIYQKFHNNGNIFLRSKLENGVQNGKAEVFDENENLIRLSNFVLNEYDGDIIEYYKNGESRTVIKVLSEKDCYQYNFYNKNGALLVELFIKEKYKNESDEVTKLPGALLYDIQNLNDGANYLPIGVWKTYNEKGEIVTEIDFESLKPKHPNVEFDCCACEIKKYEDGKLISRENKALRKIEEHYISFNSEDILNRSRHDDCNSSDIIDETVIYGDFILNRLHMTFSEEKKADLEVIEKPVEWIKGFKDLYFRPEEGQLHQYVPYYYESGEESFDHPLVSIPVTFTKSHVEIATVNKKDALKLINEIMIFNGGVGSFKNDDDNIYNEEMEMQYINNVFRIYKAKSKKVNVPIGDGIIAEAEMSYFGIDLLPPKNLSDSNVFSLNDLQRGIHEDSIFINQLLPSLNKPIHCYLEGGPVDGRFFVYKDHNSNTILSVTDSFDIAYFNLVVSQFSDDNPLLDFDNRDLEKIVDSQDLIDKDFANQSSYSYSPKSSISKEETAFCFTVQDKLMVSYYKKFGVYHLRIDKMADSKWSDLTIEKNDKMDFYVAEYDQQLIDSDFNEEARILYNEFVEDLDSINEEQIARQFELSSEVNFPFWYNIVKKRVETVNRLGKEDSIDKMISDLIYGHAAEYGNNLIDEDQETKTNYIKLRIIGFSKVYAMLLKLESNTNELLQKHDLKVNPSAGKLEYELAHAKASLYGAIKYAVTIGIDEVDLKKWCSDYEYDISTIDVEDPLESLFDKFTGKSVDEKDKSVEQFLLTEEERNKFRIGFNGRVYSHSKVFKNEDTGMEIELNSVERSIYEPIVFTLSFSKDVSKEDELSSNPFYKDMLDQVEMAKEWFKENNSAAYEILFPDELDKKMDELAAKLGKSREEIQDFLKILQERVKAVDIKKQKIFSEIREEKDLIKQEKIISGYIEEKKKYKDYAFLYNHMAYNQYEQEKYANGVKYAEIAIEKDPENAAYHDTAGYGNYMLENYPKALELLNKSIDLDPDGEGVAEHYFNRGRVHQKLNSIKEAKEDFTKALEPDPEYKEAKKHLDELK